MERISSSGEDMQLVGPLCSIPSILRSLGVDPAEVLLTAGLHASALDDPKASIPYALVGPLFEAASEISCCPHFAIEVGSQLGTESLGIVGALMRNAPTVGDAIIDFVTHQHRNAHGSVAYLLRLEHGAYFGYAVCQPKVRGHKFICDCVAAGGMNLIRELAGTTIEKNVVAVQLSRCEPPDRTPYERTFGASLCFDSGQNAIVLPLALLQTPVKGADGTFRKELEKRVREIWQAGHLDTVTHLRRLLRVGLLKGQVSADQIAASMGLSRRTLHRRLLSSGTRFEEVLGEIRCAFAEQLLSGTRLNVSEISAIVGYAEPSILTRSFRRWMGVTPVEWRARLAA